MQIINTVEGLYKTLNEQISSLGLVPTMGALHQGHLSLIERAIHENTTVVVSIYVNPTQFNQKEDLNKYPKTLEADLNLLATISNDLIVFTPPNEAIYPEGLKSKKYNFGSLTEYMEGAARPGHFNGVATVVEILFKLIKPHKAYFGEKDFQQLQIINALTHQLNMDIEVIACPIQRTADGLAMSSRNRLLTSEQKKEAAQIYQTMCFLIKKIEQWSINRIENYFKTKIEAIEGFKVDYFAIAATADLIPVKSIDTKCNYRLFTAVYIGDIRLIDTLELPRK